VIAQGVLAAGRIAIARFGNHSRRLFKCARGYIAMQPRRPVWLALVSRAEFGQDGAKPTREPPARRVASA
jgi:hypothetical protein